MANLTFRRFLLRLVLICVVFSCSSCVVFRQRQIVYPGITRTIDARNAFPGQTRQIAVDGGRQISYYLPPRKGDAALAPPQLWIVFCGNGSIAADWVEFADQYPDENAGFLLIDYPGYGQNKGEPSPRLNRKMANAQFDELAKQLNIESKQLEAQTGVLGHSLGAASALRFAADHHVERVVLLAPFTSTLDMAKLQVPWPIYHLLLYRYDNIARMHELARQNPPPKVTVIHGTYDSVIPEFMGRAVADSEPTITEFIEISHATHNDLSTLYSTSVYAAMLHP